MRSVLVASNYGEMKLFSKVWQIQTGKVYRHRIISG